MGPPAAAAHASSSTGSSSRVLGTTSRVWGLGIWGRFWGGFISDLARRIDLGHGRIDLAGVEADLVGGKADLARSGRNAGRSTGSAAATSSPGTGWERAFFPSGAMIQPGE